MRFNIGNWVVRKNGRGGKGTIMSIETSMSLYIVRWENDGASGLYYDEELSPAFDDDPIAPVKVPEEKTNNLTF